MSINFPLFLLVSTFVTGVIWLVDIVALRPRRRQILEKLESGAAVLEDEVSEKVLKEPVVVEYAISFFPVLFVVLVLRSFLIEPFQIPTGSMIPTLLVGDFIVVNKFAYGVRLPVFGTKVFDVDDPVSGDVMVFIPPHKDEYYIKRVIGTPGDTVRYENKVLYLNGVEQVQEFVAQIPPNRPEYKVLEEVINGQPHMIHRSPFQGPGAQEWVVPAGMYFMMGDNRDRSSDSRFWGFVPEENIVGKAFAVWFHWDSGLPEFSRNGWIE
ncbi:MAG: signal peptidase I [Candidatus Azotimanducaceae bacterium]|jgi:signal peptidase I